MPSLKSLIHASALALVAASVGAHAATVDPRDELPSRRVSYADLDITRTPGAAVLYSRIHSAALSVCVQPIQWEPKVLRAGSECTKAAVSRAVADIGSPLLTHVYLERTSGVTAH